MTKTKTVMRGVGWAMALLGVASCGAAPEAASEASPLTLNLNRAAAFGWNGYADTDLTFASFFGANHTLTARVMLQYPTGYAGPIIAEQDPLGRDTFFLGQADYRQAAPYRPRLLLGIGGALVAYSPAALGDLVGSTWQHVALVRTGDQMVMYLNGHHLCADPMTYPACDFTIPAYTAVPNGTVRLGRRTAGMYTNHRTPQFYGFIDDVGVFDRALTPAEVQSLASATRLTGTESGLLAGYTFDALTPAGGALPRVLSRPVTFGSAVGGVTPALVQVVSGARSNALDASFLPLPVQLTPLQLPFDHGEEWVVEQGWGDPLSHNGYAHFCLDLVRAGVANSTTCGSTIRSAAAGDIVWADDYGVSDIDGSNLVQMRHSAREYITYQHVLTDSFTEAFPGYLLPPQLTQPIAVAAGQWIAKAGTAGEHNCHLHFGPIDQAHPSLNATTIPMAFSNYEASDDQGVNWYPVARGVPRLNQWIRRP